MISKFRNNVEWSFNVESEEFIEFSLLWLFWIFISVDNVPLLVETLVSVPDNDISAFIILSTMYIHSFSFIVDDPSVVLVSEEIPPS